MLPRLLDGRLKFNYSDLTVKHAPKQFNVVPDAMIILTVDANQDISPNRL